MNCPKCGGLTHVYGSHASDNGEFRECYRICTKCSHKYRSIEEAQNVKIREKSCGNQMSIPNLPLI
jgi:transcriptional regulator NrdR family protein